MRFVINKRLLFLAFALGMGACLSPAHKLDLSASGDCPQAEEGQRIVVEGYFGIAPEKGVETESGYEGNHPYSRFNFSAGPNSKSKFEAAVVRANEGNNGSERASRTELIKSGTQQAWRIHDNERREVSFNDKVRVTGIMIRDCVVKVDRIERL